MTMLTLTQTTLRSQNGIRRQSYGNSSYFIGISSSGMNPKLTELSINEIARFATASLTSALRREWMSHAVGALIMHMSSFGLGTFQVCAPQIPKSLTLRARSSPVQQAAAQFVNPTLTPQLGSSCAQAAHTIQSPSILAYAICRKQQ